MLRHCRNASVILEKRRRIWGVGHLAGRACTGADAWGIDPVENSTEYSGGVEGVDGGGAAGRPDGIGGAEGGYALGPVFGAEKGTKNLKMFCLALLSVCLYVIWHPEKGRPSLYK